MKQELRELVERFNRNIEDYKSSGYDEENTKIDFIDRFFALLGWDINNKEGHSEEYREVVREDKVIIKGRPKSPDYSFRFGKEKLFFVEAKRPSVNIKDDTKPAYQVRRYAYSAGLTVSVLTDFEEFAIYDATVKPKENDKASIARVFYCKYNEYEKNWEFLQNTLSKKAVVTGKFKDFVVKGKGKKGTQSIDKEILKMIDAWRDILARNIALRNKHIDIYQLNEAVQKTIDRIIFLRMAEDRNTERYGTLTDLAKKNKIYDKLVLYFNSSNKKYNSGLFKIQKWLDKLAIDDKIFTQIIADLYYPVPYEFSVLPIEILGHIYEQFLGKTIRLTKGRQAKIEEKPEVRKAGGVYYTPKYIVDYIVANTVGKKLGVLGIGDRVLEENVNQDQTVVDTDHNLKNMDRTQPEINHILQGVVKEKKDVNIAKTRYPKPKTLKILDPACGSGSFLVGAYKFLLEFHLKYWTNKKNIKKGLKEEHIYQAGENNYRLTTKIKRSILLNNIYGVDIDTQAVEVTKLSLLLTMMEGEIAEAGSELFFKDRKEALLPDLKDNIKCGNSLIGSDFYADKDLQLFDMHEQRKINCFDWEKEFPEIFNSPLEKGDKGGCGGFDCVIGNPPWGVEFDKKEKEYFIRNFSSFKGNFESYQFFIEKSIYLLSKAGLFSFITPDSWLTTPQSIGIRKLILNESIINDIVILPLKVFKKVSANSIIFVLNNSNPQIDNNCKINILDENDELNLIVKNIFIESYNLNQKNWINDKDFQIKIYQKPNVLKIIDKIKINTQNLENYLDVMQGIVPYSRETHSEDIVKQTGFHSKEKLSKDYGKWIQGRAINRYRINIQNNEYLRYGKWLHRPRKPKYFNGERILVQEITGGNPPRISSCYYNTTLFHDPGIISCLLKNDELNIYYILGIINSQFISWYHKINSPKGKRNAFPKVLIKDIREFPIPQIDFSNNAEKAQHDRMVSLVEQMLEAQKEAHTTEGKSESQIKFAKQRIELLDRQIDALVYELYGLTEEEIGIVEGS